MFIRSPPIHWIVVVCFLVVGATSAFAGMPSPLPSSWTATSEAPPGVGGWNIERSAPFLQAISFFIAILLATAWAVKALWLFLRKDLAWLPALTYRGALGLVTLWGLFFIIVLTMISGARELMTPGAWRKQGWTYKLAATSSPPNSEEQIRQALEQLRQGLWHYAATHDGHFPRQDDSIIDPSLWEIPSWPGLRFLYVPGRHAESAGQLLVYQPELGDDNRLVLLTSGFIGHMRSAEIRAALGKESAQ